MSCVPVLSALTDALALSHRQHLEVGRDARVAGGFVECHDTARCASSSHVNLFGTQAFRTPAEERDDPWVADIAKTRQQVDARISCNPVIYNRR